MPARRRNAERRYLLGRSGRDPKPGDAARLSLGEVPADIDALSRCAAADLTLRRLGTRHVHPHRLPNVAVRILKGAAVHEAVVVRRVDVGASGGTRGWSVLERCLAGGRPDFCLMPLDE